MSAVPTEFAFAESRTPPRFGALLLIIGVLLVLRPRPTQPLSPVTSTQPAVVAVIRPPEPGVFQRFWLSGISLGQSYYTVAHVATNSTACHFRFLNDDGQVPCECVRRMSVLALRHPSPSNRFRLYCQINNISVAEFTVSAENAAVSIRHADFPLHFGTLFRPFRATISLSVGDKKKQCAATGSNDTVVPVTVELRYRPLDYLTDRMLDHNEYNQYSYYDNDGTVALARQSMALSASGSPSSLSFNCTLTLRRGWYALRMAVPWVNDTERKGNDATLEWVLLNTTKDDATTKLPTTNALPSTAQYQPISLRGMPPPPFHLWLRNDSIFPSCTDALTLSWRLPQINECNASVIREMMDFRVRLYASAADAADEWIYVEEFGGGGIANSTALSSWRDHFVEIPCSRFDIVHERFCFELVSVERVTRHFERWHRKCVDTEPRRLADDAAFGAMKSDDEPTSLSWSAWNGWSACVPRHNKFTGCGGGIRKRTRQCLSPQLGPTNALRCRHGKTGELDVEFCRLPYSGPADCGGNATLAARTRSTCECGCNVTVSGDDRGTFFVNASPRCRSDTVSRPLEWRIIVPKPIGIELTIVEQPHYNEWLRIYRVDADDTKQLLWQNNNNNNNNNEFSRETKLFLLPYSRQSSIPVSTVALIETASLPHDIDGNRAEPAGFYVSFALITKKESADASLRRAGTAMDNLLLRNPPLVFAALGFVLFLICAVVTLLPPVLCARLTVRKYGKWHGVSRRESAAGGRLIASTSSDSTTGGNEKRWRLDTTYSNYNNVDETNIVINMQRSMANTDSTRLTVASTSPSSSVDATNARRYSVTRRSIGIQLSRQSTPRLGGDTPRQLREDSGEHLLCAKRRRQRRNNDRSQLSSANSTSVDVAADELLEDETDALEYDYYEPPPPPGSFLRDVTPGGEEPQWMDLVSEISDIVFSDAIYSSLIKSSNDDIITNKISDTEHTSPPTAPETCDAHTQIPLSTLYSVYSFGDDDNENECVPTSYNGGIHSKIHIV